MVTSRPWSRPNSNASLVLGGVWRCLEVFEDVWRCWEVLGGSVEVCRGVLGVLGVFRVAHIHVYNGCK
jgi:hypothetical protein